MPLGEQSIDSVLTALASDAPSPGSGAAAAVALAFAAACAGKAVSISLKHGAVLKGKQEQLAKLAERSLQRADADAKYFEEYLRHKNAKTASNLLRADETSQHLAVEIREVLNEVEPHIHKVVKGDMIAARALLQAAATIEARLIEENHQM
jgi:hypothetical protein